MLEGKCLAVFLYDNKWFLAQCVLIFCIPLIWWENDNFVLLMKAHITRMWMKLHRPLYMHYAPTHGGNTVTSTALHALCSDTWWKYIPINTVTIKNK